MASKYFQANSKDNVDDLVDDANGSDDACAGSMSSICEETVTFWGAKLTKMHTVKDTRLRDEEYAPFISGMYMFDSGQIVLCDNVNNKLKFLDDISTKVKYDIPCESAPFDVAAVDEDRVVVTIPEARKLLFVIVKPGAKLDNTVNLSGECYGICVHKMTIYVCLADKGIQMLSNTGIPQRTIPHGSAAVSKYICVNVDATKIYHSGGSNKDAYVSSMTNGGHGLIKFANGIEKPAGLYVDMEDNILLLDSGLNEIYAIRNDEKRQCLLSKEAKKNTLTSMCFNNLSSKLIVSELLNSKDGRIWVSKLTIYQLEKKPSSRLGMVTEGMLHTIRRKLSK